jgi:hypothetical protein
MRTGRVVFGKTPDGLVFGQVTDIKGDEGLEVTVNEDGDSISLKPGEAHKSYNVTVVENFLNSIEISRPAFVAGDPVYHRKDGRIGKVDSAGDKIVRVAFGETVGTAKRCKIEDLINLRDRLSALESIVMEAVGVPLGEESVPAPSKVRELAYAGSSEADLNESPLDDEESWGDGEYDEDEDEG